MPIVKPFKGYRYNKSIVKKFERVLAPPYDVISAKDQQALYKKSAYNFVRIDLRKSKKASKGTNFYKAAADELNRWIEQKVFVPEEKAAMYVYEQHYRDLNGRPRKRIGFLSLMKTDVRKVKKHENTLKGPKKDRTTLMQAMRAQLSPIFGIFHDPSGVVHKALNQAARTEHVIDVKLGGIRHRLFVLNDPKILKQIARVLKDRDMYIADGHHRFEVACKVGPGYVLTFLCDATRNDFTIFPTHRVLNDLPKNWKAIMERSLKKEFKVKDFTSYPKLSDAMPQRTNGSVSFGCYLDGRYQKLTTQAKHGDLDVMVLHEKLIPKLLGEAVEGSRRIRFTRDEVEAVKAVKRRKADVAFFLSKMPIQSMMRVSDAGIKLPQKSTYFYPKVLSGLVFYKY